jgi:hypothetical protein
MKHFRFDSVPPGRTVSHLGKSPKLMKGENGQERAPSSEILLRLTAILGEPLILLRDGTVTERPRPQARGGGFAPSMARRAKPGTPENPSKDLTLLRRILSTASTRATERFLS